MFKIHKLSRDDLDRPTCGQRLTPQVRKWYRESPYAEEKNKECCSVQAKYKIGNMYLCRKHAGLYIIDNFNRVDNV